MFFPKPQILDLADRTLTLISRHKKWKSDTRIRGTPLFSNLQDGITHGSGDVIATGKTLQEAARTSASANQKTGIIP